jgi:hypothetical protein
MNYLTSPPPWILSLRLLSPMTYDTEKGCAGTSQPSPLVGGGNGLVICHALCSFSGSPPREVSSFPSMPSALWRHASGKGEFLKSVQLLLLADNQADAGNQQPESLTAKDRGEGRASSGTRCSWWHGKLETRNTIDEHDIVNTLFWGRGKSMTRAWI